MSEEYWDWAEQQEDEDYAHEQELKDAYQMGREDAIAEILSFDAKCQGNERLCEHYNDNIGCIQCIAEQMKEKKDEG